jgi:hypothetical protein
MKKLMTLMLGLAFVTGTVGSCFAQDAPKPKKEKKAKKQKNKKSKKEAPKA